MISRKLCDAFLTPYYTAMLERAKDMGMLIITDTDGDVTGLAPWLQSVGVDGVLPLERQAGVDGVKLRQQFPTLRMIGHFNKMVMPDGEQAMREEFERLVPLMKSGGFIPSVDHQTPPGVPLANYRIYLRLLDEYARCCPGR
jgi:uroporphyrinogen-III decarboxylase